MKIKLWGTRGSIPRALSPNSLNRLIAETIDLARTQGVKTLEQFTTFINQQNQQKVGYFGGNTSSYEVSHGDQSVFVDMGTGIAEACHQAFMDERKEIKIFQTHMHWDHIMGMPFFLPIYDPDVKVIIHHVHKNTPDHIRILFNGINFPLKWEQLGASIEFREVKLYTPTDVGQMTVTPFALDHPGGSFGYRFDSAEGSIAIGVDGEYKRTLPDELGKDLAAYQNLDVLIFDAQYEMDELASRCDWGHSSPIIGIDLALREGIRNLILTHHDPRSSEEKSNRMLADAQKHCSLQLPHYQEKWDRLGQPGGPNVYTAYDGMVFDMQAKLSKK